MVRYDTSRLNLRQLAIFCLWKSGADLYAILGRVSFQTRRAELMELMHLDIAFPSDHRRWNRAC